MVTQEEITGTSCPEEQEQGVFGFGSVCPDNLMGLTWHEGRHGTRNDPPENSSSSETLGDGCTEASGILGWCCVVHLY